MKLKRILEDLVSPDPTLIHHHSVDTPAGLSHLPANAYDDLTHNVTNAMIHDKNTYYVNDKHDDVKVPDSKKTDDANFKLYDFGHDGILDQRDLLKHLENLSKKFNVPLNVIQAIVNHESGWKPDAIGRNKGSEDIGLMQLNSRYIDDFEKRFWKHSNLDFDPKNVFHNAEVGVAYLADLHKQTHDNKYWERSIMAYNIGPTAVNKGVNMETGKKYLNIIAKMMHTKNFGIPSGLA
jgi:hypothetical protein